jgi:hypothetical protein
MFVTGPLRPGHCKNNIFIFKDLLASLNRAASLARAMHYSMAWRRMSQAVLKITVDENPEAIVLKIEGRLAGPWVEELDRVWEQTSLGLKQRNLTLDLREITFADAGGIRTLRAIYSQTGASLLAGTPWTQYLAEEVGASSNAAVLEG